MSVRVERQIRARQSARDLGNLVQSVFAAELLAPSNKIWLISPWISDIPVLDNSSGQFRALAPEWDRAPIPMSQVLLLLAGQGATIHIATNELPHNHAFRRAMTDGVRLGSLARQVFLHPPTPNLHEKGMLGDGYYLCGSFNFTHGGISLNEELAHFYTDETIIAENRLALEARWMPW